MRCKSIRYETVRSNERSTLCTSRYTERDIDTFSDYRVPSGTDGDIATVAEDVSSSKDSSSAPSSHLSRPSPREQVSPADRVLDLTATLHLLETMDDAYKVLFVAEAGADVVLVSSDDAVFPVRRVSLQANSDVFDDMFRSSTGATDEKDQETGLPRVKIDEKAEDIDFLLRLFVIRQIKTSTQYMSFARAER